MATEGTYLSWMLRNPHKFAKFYISECGRRPTVRLKFVFRGIGGSCS